MVQHWEKTLRWIQTTMETSNIIFKTNIEFFNLKLTSDLLTEYISMFNYGWKCLLNLLVQLWMSVNKQCIYIEDVQAKNIYINGHHTGNIYWELFMEFRYEKLESQDISHILTVIMRNSISDCISWIKSHFSSRHTYWAPDPEDITLGQQHSYKHKHTFKYIQIMIIILLLWFHQYISFTNYYKSSINTTSQDKNVSV